MSDIDKLKRWTEAVQGDWGNVDIMVGGDPVASALVSTYLSVVTPDDVLALIAENKAQAEALKIATEALEHYSSKAVWGHRGAVAREALARIKEVG